MTLDRLQIQQLIDDTARHLDIVGAQLAISTGGEIEEFATGLANSRRGTPVIPDTVFQIGSTTKVYTAALLMQLADDGVLDIDAPVITYLPELALGDPEATRAVTARHLMSMTSGIDNGAYLDTGRGDDSVRKYVDTLKEVPVIHQPGEGYGYTNASTTVSGLLVEALTGQCFEDALRDRLLAPAGLHHTASLPDDLLYHPVAIGHRRDTSGADSLVRPFFFSRGMAPAGSTLCASAGDLVRFGQLFLRGGETPDGTSVLTRASVEVMQTPQVEVPARCLADHWCVGPYLKVWDGTRIYGHSGTTPSGSSTLLWIPEHDLAVATVVNVSDRGYPFADAVLREVLSVLTGITKPPLPEPDTGLAVETQRYVGSYQSHGLTYNVTDDGGELTVTSVPRIGADSGATDDQESKSSALLPLGGHRFLPADDAFTSHHMWDVAFIIGPDGQAERLLNGAFAARRLSNSGTGR